METTELAEAIHDRLADPRMIPAGDLVKIARILGILPPAPRVRVRDMGDDYEEGVALAKGRYEVNVLYSGQENVLVDVEHPVSPAELADVARGSWADGACDKLGTEWQRADEFVISPVED